jgi:hypothetical protein
VAHNCRYTGQVQRPIFLLSGHHVASHPIAAEVIRAAIDAQVFLSKTPHLFGW